MVQNLIMGLILLVAIGLVGYGIYKNTKNSKCTCSKGKCHCDDDVDFDYSDTEKSE
jgi:uncharacterized membrane protein YebE (DUF533 family)